MEPRAAPNEADLGTYLRILNRRRLTVFVTAVVVLALALAYSLVQKPLYTATTQVLVPEQLATSALQPTASQGQLPAAESLQRMLTDAVQFAKGDATRKAATAILHRPVPISVTASSTADLLTFTASSGSKSEAAALANAGAQAYIVANRNNQVSMYTEQVTALQTSIAQLQQTANGAPPNSQQQEIAKSSVGTLTQALQQLEAASQLVSPTGPSIVNAARAPTSPVSPQPLRNGILGFLLGLLLGIALAFLRDRLDDKLKSLRDVELNSEGRPIVGLIPLVDEWSDVSETHVALAEDSTSTASESYRTLRTAIQFLGLDETQRVIGITSSTAGEGKSTTIANLAVSFARAGQRVIVVSCDFRRPRLHLFFGLDNHIGVTSVLLGEVPVVTALRDVPNEPNLKVFPSGPAPPNPAELLSQDRVRFLIESLTSNADVVLVDCPPVLPVSDALLISRLCDTTLVVTAAVSTKKSDLRRSYELLSQVRAPVRGTIVNRVPIRGAYTESYGYGYYDYSYKSSDPTRPPPEKPTAEGTAAQTQTPSRENGVGVASSSGGPVDGGGAASSPRLPGGARRGFGRRSTAR